MAQEKVTVFGGTGFLGRHVVRHLLEADYAVRVASRHPERTAALFPGIHLGIESSHADINDDGSVATAVAGVIGVVNAVSLYMESGQQTFCGEQFGKIAMAKPTKADAEAAIRVLIEWAGDDPHREGLMDTPARVARSYRELFAGYTANPRDYLMRTFEEVGGYDELVVLRNIRLVSFCEHHMLPVIGHAHVGYLPTNRVVGISKLARVVHGFARRLQIQEKLTAEIAEAIQEILQPQGVGVVIEAEHSCMTLRGVNALGSTLTTSRLLGVIRDDPRTREEFLSLVRGA